MCSEVIHRYLHTLALFKFSECVDKQVEVKCIWVVKIIVIACS